MRLIASLILALVCVSSSVVAEENEKTVLFLGDSLTAGYGLSKEESFPTRIGELAGKEGVSLKIVNAGASGDTTSGALRRLDWVLRNKPDILVVCLGANDGLRGLDLKGTKSNLIEIVKRSRAQLPELSVLLLQMELPPTFGEPYVSRFRELFKEVAEETGITLGPFLLEKVAGFPELNLDDRMHPNARGHELIAQTVWPAVKTAISRKEN